MLTFSKGKGDDRIGRLSVILEAVTDELLDEVVESGAAATDRYAEYLVWSSYMMQWAATGRTDFLPEGLKLFVARLLGEKYEPEPEPEALISIEEVKAG